LDRRLAEPAGSSRYPLSIKEIAFMTAFPEAAALQELQRLRLYPGRIRERHIQKDGL
jgi:hypothetical protein